MNYFLNLFSGILNTSSELLEFLRNPSFTKTKITKKELGNLFILKIFLVFVFFSMLNLLNLDFEDNFEFDLQSILDYKVFFLILATILFPLFEELQFRLPLSEKSKHFIFPILIIASLILSQIIDKGSLLKLSIYLSYLLFLVVILFRKKRNFKNPKLAIFGTALFFALIHIFNYELNDIAGKEYLSVILAVLPQFIGGLMLAYFRIRFGFWYGVFFHGLWNFTLISLILILFSIVGDSWI